MSRNPFTLRRILAVLATTLLTAGPVTADDDAVFEAARTVISGKFEMIEPEGQAKPDRRLVHAAKRLGDCLRDG